MEWKWNATVNWMIDIVTVVGTESLTLNLTVMLFMNESFEANRVYRSLRFTTPRLTRVNIYFYFIRFIVLLYYYYCIVCFVLLSRGRYYLHEFIIYISISNFE